jgi:hypothetical protein
MIRAPVSGRASEKDQVRRLQSVVFLPAGAGQLLVNEKSLVEILDRAKNNAGELLQDWESLEACSGLPGHLIA